MYLRNATPDTNKVRIISRNVIKERNVDESLDFVDFRSRLDFFDFFELELLLELLLAVEFSAVRFSGDFDGGLPPFFTDFGGTDDTRGFDTPEERAGDEDETLGATQKQNKQKNGISQLNIRSENSPC